MAGKLHRLTVKEVQAFHEPGRYADGINLYLQVSPSGAKSWLFMYRFAGRQREMGLGSASAGAVTLHEARERAAETRKQVKGVLTPSKRARLPEPLRRPPASPLAHSPRSM